MFPKPTHPLFVPNQSKCLWILGCCCCSVVVGGAAAWNLLLIHSFISPSTSKFHERFISMSKSSPSTHTNGSGGVDRLPSLAGRNPYRPSPPTNTDDGNASDRLLSSAVHNPYRSFRSSFAPDIINGKAASTPNTASPNKRRRLFQWDHLPQR